jgi:hypothetical protein
MSQPAERIETLRAPRNDIKILNQIPLCVKWLFRGVVVARGVGPVTVVSARA